jgi:hypothetical protein
MWSAVFLLSVVVAMDPVRIGITALLLSRPRPVLNLLVFWLGGMAAGITVAVVVLLFLRDLPRCEPRFPPSAARPRHTYSW